MALTRAQYLAPGGSTPALVGQTQGVKQGTGITIAADGTISFNSATAAGIVSSVNASGGATGLTFSGGPITTSGTLTLGGVLGVSSGGTGATSAAGGLTALLPAQAGNAGRFLTTDGSNASWGAVTAGVSQIIAGTNVSISPVSGTGAVTINAVGGGSGSVTSVATGTGLTGGPITTTGTISLSNTTVTPGTYTAANITVDAQGRITAAANGTGGGGGTVTSVATGTGLTGGPITTTGTVSLANTAVTPGNYTLGNFTVNAQGQLTAASSSTPASVAVTSVTAGAGLTGGGGPGVVTLDIGPGTGITVSGDSVSLANTAVTPGSYTLGNFTVNAQGQLTSASSSSPASVAVTTVTAGDGLTGGGGPGPVNLSVGAGTGITVSADSVSLANTAVTPGTYTAANITVDAQGRITAAANGTGGGGGTVTSVAASGGTTGLTFSGSPITTAGTLTVGGTLALANGGTGATSAAAALTNILPSQTGQNGRVLGTNGTTASWVPAGGTGTVTSVGITAGTGISVAGSPVTTSGNMTVGLANTAVTPGAYTAANITVDAQGRITSAANGAGGTVTSVNVSGASTGLTFSGGPITTSGTLTLGGTLGLTNGGTGGTSATAARTNILPSQSGNSGRVLSTNGTDVSWIVPAAGTITGVTAGTGLSGGGTSGTVTLTNTGVTNLAAGRGLEVTGSTGNITVAWIATVTPVYASQTFFAGVSTGFTLPAASPGVNWTDADVGTWNFTVPDGANQAVFIFSSNSGVNPVDYTIPSVPTFVPSVKYLNGVTATLGGGMQYTGGQSGTSHGVQVSTVIPLNAGTWNSRNIRISLITLPGSGVRNFSISFTATGSCATSNAATSDILGNYGGVQAYLQPFQV